MGKLSRTHARRRPPCRATLAKRRERSVRPPTLADTARVSWYEEAPRTETETPVAPSSGARKQKQTKRHFPNRRVQVPNPFHGPAPPVVAPPLSAPPRPDSGEESGSDDSDDSSDSSDSVWSPPSSSSSSDAPAPAPPVQSRRGRARGRGRKRQRERDRGRPRRQGGTARARKRLRLNRAAVRRRVFSPTETGPDAVDLEGAERVVVERTHDVYINPVVPWLQHQVLQRGLRCRGVWGSLERQKERYYSLHCPTYTHRRATPAQSRPAYLGAQGRSSSRGCARRSCREVSATRPATPGSGGRSTTTSSRSCCCCTARRWWGSARMAACTTSRSASPRRPPRASGTRRCTRWPRRSPRRTARTCSPAPGRLSSCSSATSCRS